jgi:photosystem II stability/assembly factor-like uncharacterized protein
MGRSPVQRGKVRTLVEVLVLLATVGGLRGQQLDGNLFKAMKWRLIGPFRGGRVLAVTGVPGEPNIYYFGAVSGGVWRTTNGGLTWAPLFDHDAVSSIGAIAVAESDPNVLYAGTGEACIRGNISHGDGVYKSTDGGKTWKNIGLKDTQTIARVIVNPHNPDVVLVAAFGHAFGPNPERGVFRSTDGGRTWEKVLYVDDNTGAIDLTFDPSNPHVLFAALWEARRTPYNLSSGGQGSGLYKSIDDGKTWKRQEGNGLPKGILGRIGVSVSGADSNRVYALIEAQDGGLYRSDDGGDKWVRVNDDHRFRQRAWYFTHIFADPKSVDTLYILNTGMYRSVDGGKTFSLVMAPHGDHHGLWIDPDNPQRMINGNDGGATITPDGGKTWSSLYNQPTAQFYHVITDNRFPYYVYGSQQDNTSVAIASANTDDTGVIDRPNWYAVGGGEAGYIAPYLPDPDIVYAGDYQGTITRFDKRTGLAKQVSVWPEPNDGAGAAGLKYRFQWTAPIVISLHDPNVLYHGAQVLLKSTDGGMSWAAISPDLTRNDKSKQQIAGGPITKDDTGTEYYDTIFSVAESPVQRNLIWAGSDDGLVHITRDGGKNWADVTPKEMPEWSLVSLIEASPHDAGTAYLAIDRHRLDDLRPYIYKTADYGSSWTKITAGIAENNFVHAVREDPKRKGLLYAGTETGVMMSLDDGGHWQPLQLNLPTTPIHDLVVKSDDLVVATHGRSFWILDDITPLRQVNTQIASEPVYLFKPGLAYRTHMTQKLPRGRPVGENPPPGAIIYYYLKSAPKENEEVKLEILDHQGKVVRQYSSKKPPEEEPQSEFEEEAKPKEQLTTDAGLNRFAWDARYEKASRIPGYRLWEYDEGARGPLALPGSYQVRLTAQGKTLTAPFELTMDPRATASSADLQKQFDLALQLRDRLTEANNTVNQVRDLRAQLKDLQTKLGQIPKAKAFVAAAAELEKKLPEVEQALINPNIKSSEDSLNYPIRLDGKLAVLASAVESSDSAPTQNAYEVFKSLSGRLDSVLAKWKDIREKDLASLNEMARKENIPLLTLRPGADELSQD